MLAPEKGAVWSKFTKNKEHKEHFLLESFIPKYKFKVSFQAKSRL